MRDTFLYALRALLPLLLTIALGYGVRRIGPWEPDFYRKLNSLCFHLLLPLNLFCNIYTIENLAQVNWRLAAYILAAVLACLAMGAVAAQLLKQRQQRGVLVQAAFRSNQAILGLPLANALGGEPALAFASVVSALTVPLFNLLAVLALTFYSGASDRRPPVGQLALRIVRNPLIVGCLAGVVAVALRQLEVVPDFFLREQLPSVYQVLNNLGKTASPLMLFVLGANLDFRATGRLLPQLSLGIFLRLAAAPALVIGTALALRRPLALTAVEMPTLVTVFASPVAVSSAVMTQEIGGDSQLASQLVVWSSVLSMGTIFLIVYLLRGMGAL